MAEAAKHVSDEKQPEKSVEKLPESFFISFTEVCTEDTTFQYTLITTKSAKDSFCIDSTQNLVSKDLYNAGNRISATCKLSLDSDEFYALVPKRDTVKKTDETQIQKYKIIKDKNNCKLDIKFVKTVGIPFKNTGINSEGIAVIESDDNKEEFKGFLIVNDVYCKPENNSHLYYVNNKMETKILHSLNDKGVSELDDICPLNGFGKDGYLILPQSFNLGYIDDENKINWSVFEEWMVSNRGDASIFFVDKKNILNAIKCNVNKNKDDQKNKGDDNKDKSTHIIFEKIKVFLEGEYKSDKSAFTCFGTKQDDGYVVEGFEAIALDENNNIIMTLECTKKDDTFNFILTARFVVNKSKNDALEIYIDPCKYKMIENNGGGANCAQEALIYCKF